MQEPSDDDALGDALALMRDLRKRCEWDAAQTHESLRPYLLEEAYEVDDAIRVGDDALLRVVHHEDEGAASTSVR